MNDNSLYDLPHLATIPIDKLIKDAGLYSPILVDTYSNASRIKHRDREMRILPISSDVEQLYSLAFIEKPVSLPCAYCKRDLAFVKVEEPLDYSENLVTIPLLQQPDHTAASSDPKSYYFGSDTLLLNPEDCEEDYRAASIACKNVLLYNLRYFFIRLSCTLNPEHEIICLFSISPFELTREVSDCYSNYRRKCILAKISNQATPDPTDAEQEAEALSKIAEHTIVLKKVGQFPSLADLQFFDLKKYQKLLKDSYRELTRAVGLHSAGIGIGSFVYLRRIFESICEEAHQECITLKGWNEEEYCKKRFNEKLDYLEGFGISILPDELISIKAKLYGVLSKGVHEYAETECQDLFPSLKMAIELLLDNKLALVERQRKISKMAKTINSVKI